MRGETFLIYGANGYTGSLVAEAARARGLAPILAGRRASAVEAVAARTGLESRGFHLMDPASAREAIRDVAVVANCAGPFSATSRAMIDACLATGTHYVDITGEVAVFEAARARDAEARHAGVVVCPGVGFDVIPTDCVAAVLAEALPDATHLALGFDTDSGVSKGTAKTVVEGLRTGCLVREGGRLVPVPLGSRRRRIDFGRGLRHAVVIPWGDVSTAFATTGIPNIEVYFAVPWAVSIGMRLVEPLRGWLAGHRAQAWLTARADRTVRGPGETDRGRTRTWVWGEARNADGRIVTARVETANAYDVTVEGVLLAVTHLLADCGTSLPPQDAATTDRRKPRLFERSAKGEKVMDDFFHGQLGSMGPGGFMTPTQLLGNRCVESLPGSGRIAVETSG